MGSECNPTKPRFDISLSKRTRKPILSLNLNLNLNLEDPYHNPTTTSTEISSEGGVDDTDQVEKGEGNSEHKSLKQLINGDEKSKKNTGEQSKSRNSLGEHFTEEEKQLQVVKLQQQTGVQGVRLKGMVKRYVKVLGHLIKVKRDPRIGSTKKPLLRLTL